MKRTSQCCQAGRCAAAPSCSPFLNAQAPPTAQLGGGLSLPRHGAQGAGCKSHRATPQHPPSQPLAGWVPRRQEAACSPVRKLAGLALRRPPEGGPYSKPSLGSPHPPSKDSLAAPKAPSPRQRGPSPHTPGSARHTSLLRANAKEKNQVNPNRDQQQPHGGHQGPSMPAEAPALEL